MLVFSLGYYYIVAARHELVAFFRATTYGRAAVVLFFIAFVVLGFVKPVLILFGVVDVR